MTAPVPPDAAEPSEMETISGRLATLRGHTTPYRLVLIFVLALLGVIGITDSAADARPNAPPIELTPIRAVPFVAAFLLWAALILEQSQDRTACRAGVAAARRHLQERLARALVSVGWPRLACIAIPAAAAALLFVDGLHSTARLAGWKAMCPAMIAVCLVWEMVERRVRVRPELLDIAANADASMPEALPPE